MGKRKIIAEDEKDQVTRDIEEFGLTDQQYLFCHFYVQCFHAPTAYLKAYGESVGGADRSYALKNRPHVRRYINHLLAQRVMAEEELAALVSEQARASLDDFVTIVEEPVLENGIQKLDEHGNPMFREAAQLDLVKAKKAGLFRLVKDIRVLPNGTMNIRIIDPEQARDMLAKAHNWYTDGMPITRKGGKSSMQELSEKYEKHAQALKARRNKKKEEES